jgi:hypothetical protein
MIEELKIQPTSKAKLHIPLCRIISMSIVRPTLLVDVKKMEHIVSKWAIEREIESFMFLPQTTKE